MTMDDQDIVKYAAIKYFRRQLMFNTAGFLKNDPKKTMDIAEMAVNDAIASVISAPCCVTYFSQYITLTAVNEEYKGLIEFIKKTPEPEKTELTNFLYPMYVYVYLALLRNDKILDAQKFHANYCKLFLNAEGYKEVINALAELKTSDDVCSHSYFKLFWNEKYIIHISDDALELLKLHLEESESTNLLSLLHSHFYIEGEADFTHYYSEDSSGDDEDYVVADDESSIILTDQADETELNELKEAIKEVTDGPLTPPATYMHTIECGKDNISAVDINSNNSLLAYALGHSSIHVWSLEDDLPSPEANEDDISVLKFAFSDLKLANEKDRLKTSTQEGMHKKILRGHSGSVFGLAFTPQFDLLMSCSEDSTVRAWSMTRLKNVAMYYGHSTPVWDIDINLDSSFFATASKDATARLWAFERTSPLRTFVGHSAGVDCVKFHCNGNYIATASSDKTIRLWTTQDARAVRSFFGHDFYISCLAFSSNGKYLASADDGGCIKIWDLATSLQIKEISGHSSRILSISFNGNDSLLASTGFDKMVRVWDVRRHSVDATASTHDTEDGVNDTAHPELLTFYETQKVSHLVRFGTKDLLISIAAHQNFCVL